MIPGATGLGYHFAQKQALHERIADAAEVSDQSSASEEYISMYQDWIRLSPEEKAENPWGQAPYGGPNIEQRLAEGRSDRLTADLPDLDKGIRHYPDELSDTLYGSDWQRVLEDYRRQRNRADIVLIAAVFLLAGGGLLLIGGLGKIMVVYGVSRLKKNGDKDSTDEKDTNDIAEPDSVDDEPPQNVTDVPEEFTSFVGSQPVSDAEKLFVGRDKQQDDSGQEEVGYFEARRKASQKTPSEPVNETGNLSKLSKSFSAAAVAEQKSVKDSYFGWALGDEESGDMETLMTTEPLTKELTELTEEMSAIRQFAAQQQDQVRKLQDGYDWMIIRRFCMRIIRSVDNIEDRMGRIDDPDSELVMCLQDIRDELIYALESSGIEQFNPDLQIPYKGLEKYAEAVRQRVPTEDASLCGCIAEIVRPGYQYLISDDDVKIVRCAQVKLYDTESK